MLYCIGPITAHAVIDGQANRVCRAASYEKDHGIQTQSILKCTHYYYHPCLSVCLIVVLEKSKVLFAIVCSSFWRSILITCSTETICSIRSAYMRCFPVLKFLVSALCSKMLSTKASLTLLSSATLMRLLTMLPNR